MEDRGRHGDCICVDYGAHRDGLGSGYLPDLPHRDPAYGRHLEERLEQCLVGGLVAQVVQSRQPRREHLAACPQSRHCPGRNDDLLGPSDGLVDTGRVASARPTPVRPCLWPHDYRNALGLASYLGALLPVIVDPSHGTGIRSLVPTMARASIAAGADGLLIEVHYRPDEALCDGSQSLFPDEFGMMMEDLRKIAEAVGRSLHKL